MKNKNGFLYLILATCALIVVILLYPRQEKSSEKWTGRSTCVAEVGTGGAPLTLESFPNFECYEWSANNQNSGQIWVILQGVSALVVAYFTYILTKNSNGQLKIYERQTSIMDRQTNISERAMTVAQWPYAYLSSHQFVTPIQHSDAGNPPFVDYTISFHGSSPAIIRAVYEDFIIAPKLPKIADQDQRGWFKPDQIKNPEEVWSHTVTYDGEKTDYTGMKAAKNFYFFIGRVIYDDLFGNQHRVGFCYRAVRGGGFGWIYGGSVYNYRRLCSDEERI